MLSLYRTAIALRRHHLTAGPLEWLPTDRSVLAFTRPGGFTFLANLSDQPVDLPAHDEILLASGPLTAGRVPPDTAVWLR